MAIVCGIEPPRVPPPVDPLARPAREVNRSPARPFAGLTLPLPPSLLWAQVLLTAPEADSIVEKLRAFSIEEVGLLRAGGAVRGPRLEPRGMTRAAPH